MNSYFLHVIWYGILLSTILLLCILLSFKTNVYYNDFEEGIQLCENNDGLYYIEHNINKKHLVVCKNGARFDMLSRAPTKPILKPRPLTDTVIQIRTVPRE